MTSRKQDKKQDTNNVNLYEDLTDAILASMLTDADLIKFIDSNHAYTWDEETLLWKQMNSNQQINTMVCEILKPIIEARREALMKQMTEVKFGEDAKLTRIQNALKQCKSLGSASKIKM